MDPLSILAERVRALEQEVFELKVQLGRPTTMGEYLSTLKPIEDLETFDEIVRLGREYRESQFDDEIAS